MLTVLEFGHVFKRGHHAIAVTRTDQTTVDMKNKFLNFTLFIDNIQRQCLFDNVLSSSSTTHPREFFYGFTIGPFEIKYFVGVLLAQIFLLGTSNRTKHLVYNRNPSLDANHQKTFGQNIQGLTNLLTLLRSQSFHNRA